MQNATHVFSICFYAPDVHAHARERSGMHTSNESVRKQEGSNVAKKSEEERRRARKKTSSQDKIFFCGFDDPSRRITRGFE